jgi:hypothetical protein
LKETEGRIQWEVEKHTDKKAYQIRKQEERESKRALRDFQRHSQQEQQDNLDMEWDE